MTRCIVCGEPGDKHHIIHKSEGGLETPLNLITLCEEHHRGFIGPHRSADVDLRYKLEMQTNLEKLFFEKYYSAMEIRSMSQLSNSSIKKFMRTNQLHKEGYDRNDIIYFLMGGNIIRNDLPMGDTVVEQL